MKVQSNFTNEIYKVVGQSIRQIKKFDSDLDQIVVFERYYQGINIRDAEDQQEIKLIPYKNCKIIEGADSTN